MCRPSCRYATATPHTSPDVLCTEGSNITNKRYDTYTCYSEDVCLHTHVPLSPSLPLLSLFPSLSPFFLSHYSKIKSRTHKPHKTNTPYTIETSSPDHAHIGKDKSGIKCPVCLESSIQVSHTHQYITTPIII